MDESTRPPATLVERPRRVVIAIAGPATCGDEQAALARALGEAVAARGALLLCTSSTGIAEAAAAGARAQGGLTLGLLPAATGTTGGPIGGLEIALPTGLGDGGATALLASSCDGLVAVGGGFGTLAAIGLALRAKKPVVLVGSWRFSVDDVTPNVARADSAVEALDRLWSALPADLLRSAQF